MVVSPERGDRGWFLDVDGGAAVTIEVRLEYVVVVEGFD